MLYNPSQMISSHCWNEVEAHISWDGLVLIVDSWIICSLQPFVLAWGEDEEKATATHSSVLAWRIPGTAEPGGLPSMGSHRVGHDWSDLAAAAAAANQGPKFYSLENILHPVPFRETLFLEWNVKGENKRFYGRALVLKRWLERDGSWGFQEEKVGKKVWAD